VLGKALGTQTLHTLQGFHAAVRKAPLPGLSGRALHPMHILREGMPPATIAHGIIVVTAGASVVVSAAVVVADEHEAAATNVEFMTAIAEGPAP